MPSRSRLPQAPSPSSKRSRIAPGLSSAVGPWASSPLASCLLALALLVRLRAFISSSSRLIGQPPSNRATKQDFGALGIFDAVRLPIVVAEVELGHIALQMIVRAMLIDALHAALEDREEAFDGIGVNVAVHRRNVLALAVVGVAVAMKQLAENLILVRLVGHEVRGARNIFGEERIQGLGLEVIDHDAARLPAIAVDQGQHLELVAGAAPAFLPERFLVVVAADEGLVHFDRAASPAERKLAALLHRLADAVRHEPRRLEGDPESAVELVGADAFLARRDQENRLEPQAHLDMGLLEDGPDLDGERLAAVVALVRANAGRFAAHLPVALGAATVRADRAFRPNLRF